MATTVKFGDNEIPTGEWFMELARITLRGQITIPAEIRRKLGVMDGDKVVFMEENGRIVMENSVRVALREVQDAFHGEAERAGLKDEQDVVEMVRELRREKRITRFCIRPLSRALTSS